MKQHLLIAALVMGMSTVAAAADEAAPASAKSVEEKAAPCAACHGPTGVSPSGAFPTSAGQHKTYLEKALLDYKSGERKNAIMAGFAAPLSRQDREDLAAYFASQSGPLTLIKSNE